MEEKVELYYQHLTKLVESFEKDVNKIKKGNKSAGVRLRKSLRYLKNVSSDFINVTLNKETKHEILTDIFEEDED